MARRRAASPPALRLLCPACSFRSPVEQFSLWVWLEMYRPPTSADLELLQAGAAACRLGA